MEPLNLSLLNPEVDVEKVEIHQSDVNRPALQLAGFFEHFDYERFQIVGMVETAYVEKNYDDHGMKMYERIFQAGIPCMVFLSEPETGRIGHPDGDPLSDPIAALSGRHLRFYE